MASRAVGIASSRRAAAADTEMVSSMKKTTKTYTYKTDSTGKVTKECHTSVEGSNDASMMAVRKMEQEIRAIQEEYESEQHLRRRVEREKQDLQMQIISLSERLTEAEGGAESQLDINRKREAEMAKLRKLLEDVHMESEQSIHVMKKKHQEAMMELQEQIEIISRSKEKVTKEKSKLSVEIEALLAQIEVLSSEKTQIKKVVERLEITVNEYNIKIDNMQRELTEVTSSRNRLKTESDDNVKKFNEMRMAIEHAGLDKNKVASQLKELQSSLDNVTRVKATAETRVSSLEAQLKTVTIQLEEQKEMRIELERQIEKWRIDGGDWKKKYETEARLRIEDVDTLKKKFGAQIADLQDQLDATLSKLKGLEQVKTRLQTEVHTLVKDLESSQISIKEFTSRLSASEKRCDELAAKLREMTNLYERADKDSKNRAQEIVRIANEMDRCKMDNDVLRRDKGKLEDDCKSYKAELDALKRQLHGLETENRKLAHDREELARAYKDADNGKNKAEGRVADLENELKKLRGDAQRGLIAKEDEFNNMRKKLVSEIESLTVRLQEAETRLKVEVEKMKKKMAVTITELEMSLDASNKSNVQLQNVSKTQATKIMELTSAFEDARRKLNDSNNQNGSLVKQITVIETELSKIKNAFGQSEAAKKSSDIKINELTIKINELVQVNNSMTQVKAKLEKELSAVSADYDDIARELKLADDRANKATHDAQHFEGLLREESAKLVKIDNVKKALETEVRSLTIKMEEIESTAITSSRRTIKQMEIRIEELEQLIVKEKSSHVETTTCLHKKERVVKELLLQSEEDRKNILILQESLDRLNEKIKMYKRQLEEQESISNSNIMRVKKFQRELECAEGRAEEAESTLNSFRSRQRVYAAAESSRRENTTDDIEREVVIKKTVTNINASGSAINESRIASSSSSAMANRATSVAANRATSVAHDYRAGSVYSRAGSMARGSSMARATSVGRAGSVLRY